MAFPHGSSRARRRAPSAAEGLYAAPRTVASLEDCHFYHTMDLPGIGIVEGDWDLRPTIDQYLGEYDFEGKRVLDVGAASGFLSFEMERRGAEVVSFDRGVEVESDVVPFAGLDLDAEHARRWRGRESLLNSYWFAHRALGSSASAHYGNVYDLPGELGTFDVAMIGTILPHLRDPFGALCSVTRLVTEAVVITDADLASDEPVMSLMPRSKDEPGHLLAWWAISSGCMAAMLEILGFERPEVSACEHFYRAESRQIMQHTYVARRRAAPARYARDVAR